MRINVTGKRKPGVYAKDIILAIIKEITFKGGTGYVLEYTGEAIRDLDMEERMTICNMAIEAGATSGMIEADQVTFDYLKGKEQIDDAQYDHLVQEWSQWQADEDATYDASIDLDITNLDPMVTWGSSGEACSVNGAIPEGAEDKALAYMDTQPGDKVAEYEQSSFHR